MKIGSGQPRAKSDGFSAESRETSIDSALGRSEYLASFKAPFYDETWGQEFIIEYLTFFKAPFHDETWGLEFIIEYLFSFKAPFHEETYSQTDKRMDTQNF